MRRSFYLLLFIFLITSPCGTSPPNLECQTNTGNVPFNKDLYNNDLYLRNLPITWSVDCTFPEEFVEEVEHGFNYWVTLNIGLFKQVSCGAGKLNLVFINNKLTSSNGSIIYALTDTKEDFFGDLYSGNITFYQDWILLSWFNMESVVRHEIGHVLGFKHIDDPTCLMYPFLVGNGTPKPVNLCMKELAKFMCVYDN